MGAATRLSDGGTELRGGALAARQEDGSWSAAQGAQIKRLQGAVPELSRRATYDAAASAVRASLRIRSIIERSPLDRCGVRWSRKPNSSKIEAASVARISRG